MPMRQGRKEGSSYRAAAADYLSIKRLRDIEMRGVIDATNWVANVRPSAATVQDALIGMTALECDTRSMSRHKRKEGHGGPTQLHQFQF